MVQIISINILISPSGENMNNNEINIFQEMKGTVLNVLSSIGEVKDEARSSGPIDDGADMLVEVTIGKKTRKILVEFKRNGEPRMVMQYAQRLRSSSILFDQAVLVVTYMTERTRSLCKEYGIGCVDLSGNAYLSMPGVLVDRSGKPNLMKERKVARSMFSPKSSMIVRTMLTEPRRGWNMNEISTTAGVSIGLVSRTVEVMGSEGYLLKTRGNITLSDPGRLLDQMVQRYHFENEMAVNYYSPFKSIDEVIDRLRKVDPASYAMTRGAGATLVLPIVRFIDTAVYITGDGEQIKEELQLEPVEFGGSITLVRPSDKGVLYGKRVVQGASVVSDLQLYLDLYDYPQRGREQAEAIREKMLRV
jgi:hypothetical protein